MKQRGFTLLEMVIGITLLGLLLTLLYGGLRLATRSWESGETSVATQSRQAAVSAYLRRQIGQIFPLRWKMEDGLEVTAFSGEANTIRFAAPISAHLGPGGLHLIAIEPVADGQETDLILRWQLPLPEQKAFDFSEEASQSKLVRGIESVGFSYFGALSTDSEPSWHETWRVEDNTMPLLVRVRIKPVDGDEWPEILVNLNKGFDFACRWDDWHKRCIE